MKNTKKRMLRSAALLTVSVLLLTCMMILGIFAEDPVKYSLEIRFTLYDEVGDEGFAFIRVELAEGEEIDLDAIIADHQSLAAKLEGLELSDEGFAGLPADGKMPASDLILSAEYCAKPFTITWVVDGVPVTENVKYGDVPVYPDGIPTKAPTAQYTYTFAGWSTEPGEAYEDATYIAVFTRTVNTYKVTWIVDGVETEEIYEYGKIPVFMGSTDKAGDAQYTHTFAGWDKPLAAVEGDVTYTAQYDTTVNEYDVTWIVDGVETTVSVPYGEIPTYTGTPVKEGNAQYGYEFTGWDIEPVPVVGNATYTAQFTQVDNMYTVTWIVGSVETTESYKYGETPSFKGSTDKAADAQYTYSFIGWDKSFAAVEGDVTYTAQYGTTVNTYTVTWIVDGETAKTETLEYGAQPSFAPTKENTAEFTYTFSGWDKEPAAVTGNVTYTGSFTAQRNKYTVTFHYGDGKTETVTVEYGQGAQAPTDTDKAATEEYTYTFKGWDVDFSRITSDLTVNAQYEQTPVRDPETEPDTSEPDTNEPDTNEPDTNEPDTNEPGTNEPAVTDPETTTPDSEPGTDPVTGEEGCKDAWWWIILVIAVAAGVAVVVIILLRRKNQPEPTEPEAAPAEPEPAEEPAEEPETPAEAAPLFIPVGEEIPEEEIPEEVETVEEVDAETVDEMMTDKVAAAFLVASDEEGGQGKMGIINVGLISAAYQAGETVDLASLQEKGMIDGNVGRLKVLASGTLDKPLIIKADAFSVQAIKMITLTGGQAIELKGE